VNGLDVIGPYFSGLQLAFCALTTLTKKQKIILIGGTLRMEEVEKIWEERWFLKPEIPVT
jgi:hypothetical protein